MLSHARTWKLYNHNDIIRQNYKPTKFNDKTENDKKNKVCENKLHNINCIVHDEAKFDLCNYIILYVTTSKDGRFSLHTFHIFVKVISIYAEHARSK